MQLARNPLYKDAPVAKVNGKWLSPLEKSAPHCLMTVCTRSIFVMHGHGVDGRYCGRECQVSVWKAHKNACDILGGKIEKSGTAGADINLDTCSNGR